MTDDVPWPWRRCPRCKRRRSLDEYVPPRGDGDYRYTYCVECRKAYRRAWATKRAGYYSERRRARGEVGKTKPCVVCGTEFVPRSSERTCSPECRHFRRAESRERWNEKRRTQA